MENPLSLKVTVPVGVMIGSGRWIAPVTVTVKVTGVPTSLGFAEEATVIDPTLTNCAKAGEGMAPRARPSRISQPFNAARLLLNEASFFQTPPRGAVRPRTIAQSNACVNESIGLS